MLTKVLRYSPEQKTTKPSISRHNLYCKSFMYKWLWKNNYRGMLTRHYEILLILQYRRD